MKILHTEASCGWGGQEIRILEEMRGIAARGHSVSLVCPPHACIHSRAKEAGLDVHALPIGRKNLGGIFALRRWLIDNTADVINSHSSTDTWLAALACKTMRGPPPLVRTRHISSKVPDNLTSRWLYKSATRHLVTTGEQLRTTLIRDLGLAPERVTSVPTGIDTERFSPGDRQQARRATGLKADARWIGIVATLRSWKGHMVLLDALVSLARPELHLVIVGDGPMRSALEARTNALGLLDRVVFAGEQRAPEQWMRACEVFCLPSYANEGVPQALMQAMLCGLPVVSTPVGAITEIVSNEETGLIVAPQDSLALAAALGRILDDDALACRLGAAARREGEQRFGFARMIDRMEGIFLAAAGRDER